RDGLLEEIEIGIHCLMGLLQSAFRAFAESERIGVFTGHHFLLPDLCWSMIFSENRLPLFGIMLCQQRGGPVAVGHRYHRCSGYDNSPTLPSMEQSSSACGGSNVRPKTQNRSKYSLCSQAVTSASPPVSAVKRTNSASLIWAK